MRLEPEYQDAYNAWKAKDDEDTRADFLGAIKPTMERNVNSIIGTRDPMLMSKARLLSLQALRSYDPNQASFNTHLYGQLQGLRRMKQKQEQILSMPQRIAAENYNLQKANDELSHELGRDPTDAELADRTGYSSKRISYVRRYHQGASEGQMDEGGVMQVTNPMQQHRDILAELVYDELDAYHQKIMEYTLGLNGQPTLSNQDIARKLGRSPGAISQAKKRIQDIYANMEEVRNLL